MNVKKIGEQHADPAVDQYLFVGLDILSLADIEVSYTTNKF